MQIISNDKRVRNNAVNDLQNSTINLQQHKLKRRLVGKLDAIY